MPRKKTERLTQFHRESILETSERLFFEKGIRETTMDDIAKAADYSKSTLYVYFKSKDEIHHHILYGHMCRMRDGFQRCVQQALHFEACYFQICNMLVSIYQQQPLYFESMMGRISVDEQELAEQPILGQIFAVGEEINDCLLALFEEGIRTQYLRADLLCLPAIFTLWAALANTILLAHRKEQYIAMRMNLDKAAFMQYSFELLLTSLRKG